MQLVHPYQLGKTVSIWHVVLYLLRGENAVHIHPSLLSTMSLRLFHAVGTDSPRTESVIASLLIMR